MNCFPFETLAADPDGAARVGRLTTPHGVVETPVFMPVGTRAAVKGLTPEQLHSVGASFLLANTYHLALRPGAELVERLGGLHCFMAWDGPLLTDSGGYQVFSLESLRKIDDDGVEFRSHIDGQRLRLTPESATQIQQRLGADVAMCFDECPPAGCPRDQVERAVARTTQWARRCRKAHQRGDQALFGIVQGGLDPELRARSAGEIADIGFDGYALGGLSVGEENEAMHQALETAVPLLPPDRPRYLMGVGEPADILEAVRCGVDMFDCVLPTRNGRNALAFTSQGKVRLRNAQYLADEAPLDPECRCYACRRFSRAYLRHLFQVREMLGPILVSLHNVAYYLGLMERIRTEIRGGTFARYHARFRAGTLAERPVSP
jgi:queuine tRNA-ribosyltransferase